MRVTVLGTGSADGWPNACCSCAACRSARAQGSFRAQTCALVDDTLLLDCGPTTLLLAEQAGAPLDRMRHLLFSHAHPDHCFPAALLFRSWVRDDPLDVVGPAAAVGACRDWVAPDAPVALTVAEPGDRLRLGGYRVRVLAARHGEPGSCLSYDVTGADGRRLLYATDTGPLLDETLAAVEGRAYDLVLLEETFGERTDHGTDHLDLASFPVQLARLRDVAAVTSQTRVVAVHLSHSNPTGPELSRRLADWGAEVVADGNVVELGSTHPPPPRRGRTLVLGGARSGKSREAERVLADQPDVAYVATSAVSGDDAEWHARIRAHRDRRPSTWTTLETRDLVPLLRSDGPPLLVDCLTLWLAGTLDRLGAWDADPGAAASGANAAIDALTAAWAATPRRVVAVSNEVGAGIVPDTVAGRVFRDLLGRLNAEIAARTEDVRLLVAGRVVTL